jgi:hypothetical protein
MAQTGYIDKTGKVVIKPQWGDVWRFFDGIAYVTLGEFESSDAKFGYIDKTGKYIWEPTR